MDGSARFQEGCGNWVLGEVQKLIILTHLHREIRRMRWGGGLFPPVEWLCWHGDNTDASFGK